VENLPPGVPNNFRVFGQGYEVSTTAGFDQATVCFDYDDSGLTESEEAQAELSHFDNGVWVNVTDPGYPDTVNNRICGTVSSFSPFTILVPLPFNFTGFFQPVDNLPVVNVVNAGRAIPVKFSLDGDKGLEIFGAGYPKSQAITCGSNDLLDGIEVIVTAGSSGLTYDPATRQYVYVWNTDTSWGGTCRQLVIQLADGTYHRANFKFR
jgi:hypothetical protein